MPDKTSQRINPAAVWTFIGSLLVLGTLGYVTKGFAVVLPDFVTFLKGGVDRIRATPPTFLMMIPFLIALLTLKVPALILASVIQGKVLGETGQHSISEMLKNMREGNHFQTFFLLVLGEELFARWLFLGLLTRLPFLSGALAFYLLFFLGNSIWALIHLTNFQEEKDRHWFRTFPQFVGGVFSTYAFVKYGLLGAILLHFASNALVFSLHKKQSLGTMDVWIFAYNAICLIIGLHFLSKPLSDILLWFGQNPTFALPGWHFWDYIALSLVIQSTITLAIDLLLYDRTSKEAIRKNRAPGLWVNTVSAYASLGMIYGIYYLLGMIIPSVPYRIVSLSILLAFVVKTDSGSAMSRVFWEGMPSLYLTLCPLFALNFWQGAFYLIVRSLIAWPELTLALADD